MSSLSRFVSLRNNYVLPKLTHLVLGTAFDGADEKPETGKKIMANLLQYPLSLTTLGSPQVVSYCTPDTCANRGVCQDAWISPACDCDLTSFTGPTCTDGRVKEYKGICVVI